MTTRELLEMALDALESCINDPKMRHTDTVHYQIQDAEKALRAHLAKPEPEPVAWMHPTSPDCISTHSHAYANGVPLYRREDV